MADKILMVSESADLSASPIGALVACLATIVLDINDNSVSEFRTKYRQWYDNAKGFAKKHNFGPEFDTVSKRVMRGDDMYGDDDDVVDLGTQVRRSIKTLKEDTRLDLNLIKLVSASARCLIKDDERAWNFLEQKISLIRDTRLTSVFLSDEDEPVSIDGIDPTAASTQMRLIYKRMTGSEPKYGYAVSPTDIPKYRNADEKLWTEYSRLSKVLNKETKRLVFRFVRNKQLEMASVDEVSKFLDKAGLLHNMPRGFTGGQVDENFNFYTAEGRKLDKAPSGLVKMNPKYDPSQDNTYVMFVTSYGTLENGKLNGAGRIRTETMNAANKVKRHAVVSDFLENEDKYRAKWLKDLRKEGSKEQLLAVMVELLHNTSARIGGKGNMSEGKTTYGLTTLTASHVKIKGSFLLFDYVGKKMAPQPAKYPLGTAEGRIIGEVMKKILANRDPDEPVFEFRGKRILRHAVNRYIQSLGPAISAHSFRRATGTKEAMKILAKHPFATKKKNGALKEAEVHRWIKQEMQKVGVLLNHRNGEKVTGMTAIKSYIDPAVLTNFYDSLGIRVPSFVPGSKG